MPEKTLSRRERQMMDILYRRGRATASEIHAELPDRPSYSAVLAKLRVLAGCCFCSIGYAGKDSQPPRTANDGHPVSPGAGHRFRDPRRVAGPAQLLGGARQAARAG